MSTLLLVRVKHLWGCVDIAVMIAEKACQQSGMWAGMRPLEAIGSP